MIYNRSFGSPLANQPNGLLFGKGEEGAMAFPQSPNTTQAIFDMEEDYLYVTTVDAIGIKSMRKFEVHEVELEGGGAGPVSRKEFDELVKKVNSIHKEAGDEDA